jgi:phosphatidylinositol kinase/protein kinase (PI-3  family)
MTDMAKSLPGLIETFLVLPKAEYCDGGLLPLVLEQLSPAVTFLKEVWGSRISYAHFEISLWSS